MVTKKQKATAKHAVNGRYGCLSRTKLQREILKLHNDQRINENEETSHIDKHEPDMNLCNKEDDNMDQ